MSYISKEQAIHRYTGVLNNLKNGGTKVYEVRSFAMNTDSGVMRALQNVSAGDVVWQHTNKWHSAAIYIQQGKGYEYHRNILDLIGKGVDSVEKFSFLWDQYNDGRITGVIPQIGGSATSTSRQKQMSYVVANLSKGELRPNHISGSLTNNVPHRTHLISSQVTGIENHRGLLIDFDGWLNMNPLNNFEQDTLKMTRHEDVIWTVQVWPSTKGLCFEYRMFDIEWNLVSEHLWVDDRWEYIWYFDDGQDLLT